jgi:tetratricopeptide (TPR) repeat protein
VKRVVALLLSGCLLDAAAWTPPDKPDPDVVLKELRDDRVAGRYEVALEKHLWFHEHALRYQPSLAGVRLSFALGDWGTLAAKHPPALAALRELRARKAQEVREGRNARDAFQEVAAIDRELDEHAGTVELFRVVEAGGEAAARASFPSAQDALIEAKDFATVAKYLSPDRELKLAADTYQGMMRAGSPPSEALLAIRERFYAIKVSRLVAVLVLAGQPEEARRAAARAVEVSGASVVREMLARAAEGQLPPPIMSAADRKALRATMP